MRLKLFFSIVAAAAMIMTGCNKQTELEINYGKTARLQGQVTIFDENGASSQVASDIKIYAEVPYDNLVTTATRAGSDDAESGNNGNNDNGIPGHKIFEATTDENGIYTFDIPVIESEISSFDLYTERKEINGKFYYGEVTVDNFSTSVNSTTVKNINMFATEAEDAVFVVKGKVVIDASPENIPAAGIKVEFAVTMNGNIKTFTATTNTQGEFTISLPKVSKDKIDVSVPDQTVAGRDYKQQGVSPVNPGEDGTISSDIVIVDDVTPESGEDE